MSRNGHHRWDKKGVIWTCFSLESESICFHDLIPTCSFSLILQVALYVEPVAPRQANISGNDRPLLPDIYIYILTGNWKMRVPIYRGLQVFVC